MTPMDGESGHFPSFFASSSSHLLIWTQKQRAKSGADNKKKITSMKGNERGKCPKSMFGGAPEAARY